MSLGKSVGLSGASNEGLEVGGSEGSSRVGCKLGESLGADVRFKSLSKDEG